MTESQHGGTDSVFPRNQYPDLAWKWFDFHARQRTTMFNFFLVITGILANALVGAVSEGHHDWAIGLGSLGIFVALGFMALDYRNHQLVKLGERALEKLEGSGDFKTAASPIFTNDSVKSDRSLFRHKWLIPILQGAIIFAIVLGLLHLPKDEDLTSVAAVELRVTDTRGSVRELQCTPANEASEARGNDHATRPEQDAGQVDHEKGEL